MTYYVIRSLFLWPIKIGNKIGYMLCLCVDFLEIFAIPLRKGKKYEIWLTTNCRQLWCFPHLESSSKSWIGDWTVWSELHVEAVTTADDNTRVTTTAVFSYERGGRVSTVVDLCESGEREGEIVITIRNNDIAIIGLCIHIRDASLVNVDQMKLL